ncbi:MAG: apolipoprotein N-acyltransferase [Nocardioides marinisabuli]|uniref:apolipoprotein N-acyltransferase n=1 Tax=Nocardioides marinisabuli TaxID=419476 RepID=UPI00321A1F3C
MTHDRFRVLAFAAVGGALTALAFPPWAMPWLAPIGIAGLVVAVNGRSAIAGGMAGGAFGLVFFGTTLWWVSESIAVAAWGALMLTQAAWVVMAGTAMTLVRPLRGWPAWTALVWTSVETVRSLVPWGGMPWGRLGYTAVDAPWEGSLAIGGVSAASALIVLIGALVAGVASAVSERRPVLRLTRPVIAAGSALGVGMWLMMTASSLGGRLGVEERGVARVGVVQGGVPGDGTQVAANHRRVTQNQLTQTRRMLADRSSSAPVPDFVLWPENATAVDPVRDSQARAAVSAAVTEAGAPVLLGAIVDTSSPATALNEAIVWTASGPESRYTKQHLVPFGEYVPLRPLAQLVSSRVADIGRDMVPGGAAQPLTVGDLRVAAALCFDVAYDDVVRSQVALGADLVTVQTSNAMFLGTAQLEQQWIITRARAVEVGRSVVVASINGISGAVGPDGRVIERLSPRVSASSLVEVPTATGTSLAVQLGPWPSRAAGMLAIVAVAAAVRQRQRVSVGTQRPARLA